MSEWILFMSCWRIRLSLHLGPSIAVKPTWEGLLGDTTRTRNSWRQMRNWTNHIPTLLELIETVTHSCRKYDKVYHESLRFVNFQLIINKYFPFTPPDHSFKYQTTSLLSNPIRSCFLSHQNCNWTRSTSCGCHSHSNKQKAVKWFLWNGKEQLIDFTTT